MPRRGKIIPFPGRPKGRPAAEPRDERSLVEVHRCAQAEAVVVRALFESEGIPVLFRSRIAHSVQAHRAGACDQGAHATPASPAAARWPKTTGPCWPTPIRARAGSRPGGCVWSAR